ncbi:MULTISPECIES: ABC transporter ATP-binding protein [Brevibacillus]|jgi:peptide/nickel transport system ATP-binding protein|uniref:ABC transporter ATP-binding protein n=1 Tax=Brevibacillus TaxID=55080 RepID=UPI00046843D5|nr:ABC transporter ATP-binding protein [Brevibacillus borstelensis]KKX55908.1 peptide ABC transporter ATP-binding protein [Brevibacillus borstelensis cifa_chp40]MBE5396730.1 ABC transporter ATP-binding protein [Brevibacillus borstelensis]MCC0564468.1 ABC transporter ATP-binding protein [Brevibacillus borstelensis]MCM3471178.1 ABC transporter ATP-binding protein [Brevibacillus borstelensis]MCM3559652.1 ABC transporter ATP-binding protein [Brevibacillus borstelensis]
MSQPVLEIENLQTHFFTDRGQIPAVDGVTITVNKGEVLGIVGESGCGKSVTSLSVMKLVPNPPGKIVGGSIKFKGEDLVLASEKRMREIRGNEIAMIFQEPMTSLNPVYTIGDQIGEAIRLHMKVGKKEALGRAVEMLKKVGIPRAEGIVREYPHQLSGGMRQRVMIAMAMACNPELLIADEPTTALDVTIQAQILDLMRHVNKESGTAILLITHDLGVVAEMCHRVVVMYAGNVVEEGDVRTILKEPKHPYTIGLLNSLPKLEVSQERLYSIPGNVPIPGSIQMGCRFSPRCEQADDKCRTQMPELKTVGANHRARCWMT